MKIKSGIIGTGNIGTDLLVKMTRSSVLDPVIFVGRRSTSNGISLAESLNIPVSYDGIDHFISHPHCCDVVFDCTNAQSAITNSEVFANQGIKVVDMTPAKVGHMCVPTINAEIINQVNNVNMITCGGQASIPLLHEISKVTNQRLNYIEIVSQIASKSAGIATRVNLDHYIHTTEAAIQKFTGCADCKVIINLNPAEPCVDMQTTMFIDADELPFNELVDRLTTKIKEIKRYVPNYDMVMMPVVNDDGILILSVRVRGLGDYLPSYAGNLDIINCAAITVAERMTL
jgi:acetaldehyde dehydrogenase (acetylating)